MGFRQAGGHGGQAPACSIVEIAWPCCGALSAQRRVARCSDRRDASLTEAGRGVKNKVRTLLSIRCVVSRPESLPDWSRYGLRPRNLAMAG